MCAVDYGKMIFSYQAFKSLNANSRFFDFQCVLDGHWRLAERFQNAPVKRDRQQMEIRCSAQKSVGQDLLMPTKRHLPWRKSKKDVSPRFEEISQSTENSILVVNVLNDVFQNDEVKER